MHFGKRLWFNYIETWKETGEVSKEGEADQELEKASQEEHKNHNHKLVESQEDKET